MIAPRILHFPVSRRDPGKVSSSAGLPAEIIDISRLEVINRAAVPAVARKLIARGSMAAIEAGIKEAAENFANGVRRKFEIGEDELQGAKMVAVILVRAEIAKIRQGKK